jgi:hypothetical protein
MAEGTKGAVATGRNMQLWDSVFKTDPQFTKDFKKGGGFEGTAISPMYLFWKATKEFGPHGTGWGWELLEDRIESGVEGTKVWFAKVRVWYRDLENPDLIRHVGPQWGATEFSGERRNGNKFVDEEAAKKSVTDAVTKCLTYLGFAADVHMGKYDDNKYVAEITKEFAAQDRAHDKKVAEEKKAAEETPEQRAAATQWLEGTEAGAKACTEYKELLAFWEKAKPRYDEMVEGSPAEKKAAEMAYQTVRKLAGDLKKKAPAKQAAE